MIPRGVMVKGIGRIRNFWFNKTLTRRDVEGTAMLQLHQLLTAAIREGKEKHVHGLKGEYKIYKKELLQLMY